VFNTWHEVYKAEDKIKICIGVNGSNLHMNFHLVACAKKYRKDVHSNYTLS
jgi:hypothetical protein